MIGKFPQKFPQLNKYYFNDKCKKRGFLNVFSLKNPHFGADEGTRTQMVSHRNLKPARLPVSPHPRNVLLIFTRRERLRGGLFANPLIRKRELYIPNFRLL